MRTFHVEITEPAEADIEQAHDWIHAKSEQAAERWIGGLSTAIER